MPVVSAAVSHPAAPYVLIVTAVAACIYAWHARSIVAGCAAAAAVALALWASEHAPPDARALLLLALGVALLECEFRVPTCGAALVAGLTLGGWGSWLLLAAGPAAELARPVRLALAVAGALALLAAVLRGVRIATLRRR